MLSTQIAVCGLVLFVRRSRAALLLERQYVRVSAVGIVWWHQLLGLSKGNARLTRTFVARHGTTQRALLRSSRGCCQGLQAARGPKSFLGSHQQDGWLLLFLVFNVERGVHYGARRACVCWLCSAACCVGVLPGFAGRCCSRVSALQQLQDAWRVVRGGEGYAAATAMLPEDD